MSMRDRDRHARGNAGDWFAGAAAAIIVTAAIGAYGMAWLAGAEGQHQSAFLPLNEPAVVVRSQAAQDMEATGSIGPASAPNGRSCRRAADAFDTMVDNTVCGDRP